MSDDFEVDEELDDDQALLLQRDIADCLATLSEVVETPEEFDGSNGPFDASDVDFASGTWMQRLLDIQGWLRLEEKLPQDADLFVNALVAELGLDPATAIDATGQYPQLTLDGLEQLSEKLSQASRLQQLFVDNYSGDSATRKSASEAWKDAWEQESDFVETDHLKPVSALAETWPVADFIGRANRINLNPSYQRGDVWGTPARQLLIESILRGIPLPSVILLQPEGPRAAYEVVDGKQRLTAILRFAGQHQLALERVKRVDREKDQAGKLLDAFSNDYPKFRHMWKSLIGEPLNSAKEDEYYFPFKLPGKTSRGLKGPKLEPLKGKYFTQIIDFEIEAADEVVLIGELFNRTVAYKIPVILYKRADQLQIHEVFHLYNKQGVHLNAEEIRNAIYHELELTRATLVAAGDSDRQKQVAPALDPVWSDVQHLGQTLREYQFGESRYRRTKILSWVIATLLGDTGGKDLPSTASHINNLLMKVQEQPSDPLNQQTTIAALFRWIAESAKIHAENGDELWAPRFKDGGDGQKWQELQLVGSLVGIAIAYAANPETISETVQARTAAIFDASATAIDGEQRSVWTRPKKATTRSQWAFIANVANEVTKILDVDTLAASTKIKERFGSSGVESLLAVIRDDAQ
jgi:hypothetical protein